jgi:hypothetical protein
MYVWRSEAAGGEEGAEAAQPDDDSAVVATCLCEADANVYPAPGELTGKELTWLNKLGSKITIVISEFK